MDERDERAEKIAEILDHWRTVLALAKQSGDGGRQFQAECAIERFEEYLKSGFPEPRKTLK